MAELGVIEVKCLIKIILQEKVSLSKLGEAHNIIMYLIYLYQLMGVFDMF